MRSRSESHDRAQALHQFVVEGIRRGRWKPGEKLPTERELVGQFDIARSAVRKVLDRVHAQGLITRTVGRGTEVAGTRAALDIQPGPDVSPADLMDARLVFEPAIAELVVRNASAADFGRMRDCLRRAERAETFAEFEQWDDALHRAIANATHNSFVIRVFDLIGIARGQASWGRLKNRSLTPERRATYQVEHRRLVEAFEERDLERARERTLAHLRRVRQNLLES